MKSKMIQNVSFFIVPIILGCFVILLLVNRFTSAIAMFNPFSNRSESVEQLEKTRKENKKKTDSQPQRYRLKDGRIPNSTTIQADAQKIGDAIGLYWGYALWPVENEAAIIQVLSNYLPEPFTLLRDDYNNKYKRSLVDDLTSYLSSSQLSQVQYLWWDVS